MIWAAAGCGYAALYIGAVLLMHGRPHALLLIGNICQLLPPLLPILVVLRRRKEWIGRHRVLWDAIAVGATLWLAGQTAWAVHELLLAHRLPVIGWTIVRELCGSAMPLIALMAWPHRGQRPETSWRGVHCGIAQTDWARARASASPSRAPALPGRRLPTEMGFKEE